MHLSTKGDVFGYCWSLWLHWYNSFLNVTGGYCNEKNKCVLMGEKKKIEGQMERRVEWLLLKTGGVESNRNTKIL